MIIKYICSNLTFVTVEGDDEADCMRRMNNLVGQSIVMANPPSENGVTEMRFTFGRLHKLPMMDDK